MGSGQPISTRYLAIVNPAAGNGRCGRRAPAVLERLRQAGIEIEMHLTEAPREATRITQEGYAAGYRRFIAVGGDGTCWEVLNGLAPQGLVQSDVPSAGHRASLAVLPLGTGNSFLREFTTRGMEHSISALIEGRKRRCDVCLLTHADGKTFYVNLFGFGFAADVTANTQRGRYKRYGNVGYVLGVLHTIAKLRHPQLTTRVDEGDPEPEPVTFLCVCNSRFTAGSMLMAPDGSIEDGRADLIRVEPLGRFEIIRTFPKIYSGTHVRHPAVSARAIRRIDFSAEKAIDVMVDGEVLTLTPRSIEVVPGALDVYA